jgi:OFA family oxalate/formate antiporter-like MFS transporter
MTPKMQSGAIITVSASLFAAALGTVHAFSVFVAPFEQVFGASRSSVSLTYSLALVCLTIAVLAGHTFYARWSAARFLIGATILGVVGLIVAGMATSLPMVWFGYSLCFGVANGLGYGFGLQLAAQANRGNEGLAMGVVTAAYALGAVLAPAPFEMLITLGGPGAAMFGLAAALGVIGLVSAIVLTRSGARYTASSGTTANGATSVFWRVLVWVGYFGGVMAGLMVIGHAAGIDAMFRPGGAAWVAPALLAACNLLGSLVGGRAADRFSARTSLTVIPVMTFLSLLALSIYGGANSVLVCIGAIGFAYGATIAVYPSVIAKTVGPEASAMVYGRVFTAWGAAGLAGPWLAGALFDWKGTYFVAFLVAAFMAAISILAAGIVFRRQVQE